MILLPPTRPLYAGIDPVDFRRSFGGLVAIAREQLGLDALRSAVVLFVGDNHEGVRRNDRAQRDLFSVSPVDDVIPDGSDLSLTSPRRARGQGQHAESETWDGERADQRPPDLVVEYLDATGTEGRADLCASRSQARAS